MADQESPNERTPEIIEEESTKAVETLRELIGNLKIVQDYERSILSTPD
jgi:hypothetical protein